MIITSCDQFNSIVISYNHPMWEDVLFSSEVNLGGQLDNYMIKTETNNYDSV